MPGNTDTENLDEELKALIKKRASVKSKLTIFEKFIEKFERLQLVTESVDRRLF